MFLPFLSKGQEVDNVAMVFKDTVYSLAFDSLKHDFGIINSETANKRLVKHFKYLGSAPLRIEKAWTGDPHYICDYPKEELIPNKIYSYTVCFSHRGRQGRMHKQMGFDLSDGNRVFMLFTGNYHPSK